jgi:hypothetical protein
MSFSTFLEVLAHHLGVRSDIVVSAIGALGLDDRLLRCLGGDSHGAGGRLDADGDVLLLTDQARAVALEAASLQFIGKEAGHLFGRQHFEDLQLSADVIFGADGAILVLADSDTIGSAHDLPAFGFGFTPDA